MAIAESFEAQCRGAISLVPVYFSIVNGQICTQSDAPLQTILGHVLHQLVSIDRTTDHHDLSIVTTPTGESAIVRAIFDETTLPLVTAEHLFSEHPFELSSEYALEHPSSATSACSLLDPQQKARLLVEGIAGAVAIVARLAQLRVTITSAVLARELERFAASSRPQHIRHTAEHSHLFSECLMMSQILDLIMDAALGEGSATGKASRSVSFEDYTADMFCLEHERSTAHSMGLPWGLTFMVLN